jgi:hypothetical protein
LLAVGMKNGLINTYMLDVMAEQKQVNFWSFIKERWDLFFGMLI